MLSLSLTVLVILISHIWRVDAHAPTVVSKSEYEGWRGKAALDAMDMFEICNWMSQLNDTTMDEALKYYWVNSEVLYSHAAVVRGMFAAFHEMTKTKNFAKTFLRGIEIIIHYIILKSYPIIGRRGGIRGNGADRPILKAAIPPLIACYKKPTNGTLNFTVAVFPIVRRRKKRRVLFHPVHLVRNRSQSSHRGKRSGENEQELEQETIDDEASPPPPSQETIDDEASPPPPSQETIDDEASPPPPSQETIDDEVSPPPSPSPDDEVSPPPSPPPDDEVSPPPSPSPDDEAPPPPSLSPDEAEDENALDTLANAGVRGRYAYTLSHGSQSKAKMTNIVVGDEDSGGLENVAVTIFWLIYEVLPPLCQWTPAEITPYKDAFDKIVGLVLSMYLYDKADFAEQYARIFIMTTPQFELEWEKIESFAKGIQREKKLQFTKPYSDAI